MRYLFILLLAGSVFSTSAQGPYFSQYMYNQMVMNPAHAGADGVSKVGLNGRLQYPKLSHGGYSTGLAQANLFFDSLSSGAGSYFMIDHRDFLTDYYGNLSYAYHLYLTDEDILQIGAGFTLIHKTLNIGASELIEAWQIDTSQGPVVINESGTSGGFGAGLWYHRNQLFLGVSTNYFNQPEFSFGVGNTRVPRTFYFTGGYEIDLQEGLTLLPSFLYRYNDLAGFLDLALLVRFYETVTVGASLGGIASYNLFFGLALLDQWQFTLSYDYYKNEFFRKDNGGSYEVGVRYIFKSGE